MKLVYFSGVTGKPGIKAVKSFLKENSYDIILAGVDNLSFYSRGLHSNDIEELRELGVNVMCGGNYSYSHPSSRSVFAKYDYLLRPLNLYKGAFGSSYFICNDIVFIVFLGIENTVNLFGRNEFSLVDSPFDIFDEFMKKFPDNQIIIDYHGGSFIEKRTFANYVKNRAVAVIGSHENVQTSDEMILNNTCAYISDAGFCGVKDSINGLSIKNYIRRFLSLLPEPIPREEDYDDIIVQGVEIEIENNKSVSIKRISEIY